MSLSDEELKEILDMAVEKTDKELASRISSITRMTDDEVIELFPEPSDAKKVAELMAVVKASEARNYKINKIVAEVEKFGGVILTLLERF